MGVESHHLYIVRRCSYRWAQAADWGGILKARAPTLDGQPEVTHHYRVLSESGMEEARQTARVLSQMHTGDDLQILSAPHPSCSETAVELAAVFPDPNSVHSPVDHIAAWLNTSRGEELLAADIDACFERLMAEGRNVLVLVCERGVMVRLIGVFSSHSALIKHSPIPGSLWMLLPEVREAFAPSERHRI